uniref:Uncharacterized protein n=1 Tax=Gossypium raimondii TaxID=29730 RepID=A0A0D2NTG1_GOSRA|nr:hypothetical protein B456_002G268900 [Gossypium raimondii]
MFSLAPLVFVIFEIRCFNETHFSGIQKRISSSPNDMKLIVFSFIRISLAYTELKGIYEVMAIFVKLKLNSADSLLMLYVVMHSLMA